MLRSTWSPVTCGVLTSGTGRAFLLHPFQSFCVLSSCYQHQQWLTCHRVKLWNTAQPISSEVVLTRHSYVLGETLRLMTTEYLSKLSAVPLTRTPPACAQPGSHSRLLPLCGVSMVWLGHWALRVHSRNKGLNSWLHVVSAHSWLNPKTLTYPQIFDHP